LHGDHVIISGRERKYKLTAWRHGLIYSVTSRVGSAKATPRLEGLLLCDIVPDIQEHLGRSFDRTYHLTISDALITESLSRGTLSEP
jgi:hypothetical protein